MAFLIVSTAVIAWFLPCDLNVSKQFFFDDNITFSNMYKYSKSRVVPAKQKISPVTLALQLVSGEKLIAEFRPEGIIVRSFKKIVNVLTNCMH